jgi:hypothetical protein
MTGERAGTDEPNPWPRPTSGPQGLGQVERRSSTRARSSQRARGIAAGALFTLLISGLVYLVVETADGNETVASETAPSSEGSDGSAASEGTAPDGQAAATDATTTAS